MRNQTTQWKKELVGVQFSETLITCFAMVLNGAAYGHTSIYFPLCHESSLLTQSTRLCGATRLECCESCTVVIIRDTCSLLPPNVALSLSWLRLPRVLETFHWLLLYPVKTETHIHTVKLLVNNVATVVRHCLVLLRRNAGCVWGVKWYNALSDIVMQEYVV